MHARRCACNHAMIQTESRRWCKSLHRDSPGTAEGVAVGHVARAQGFNGRDCTGEIPAAKAARGLEDPGALAVR